MRLKRAFFFLSGIAVLTTLLSLRQLFTAKHDTFQAVSEVSIKQDIQKAIQYLDSKWIEEKRAASKANHEDNMSTGSKESKAKESLREGIKPSEQQEDSSEEFIYTNASYFQLLWKHNRTTHLTYNSDAKTSPASQLLNFSEGCKKQYEKFLALNPTSMHLEEISDEEATATLLRISQYKFNIHTPTIVSREKILPEIANAEPLPLYVLQIEVDETYKQKPTKGGTAFRMTSTSQYHTVCGFNDQFDGKYYFFCPVYGSNVSLSVQLSHIDYHGYRGQSSAYDEYIWHEKIYIDDPTVDGLDSKWWMHSEYHQKFSSPHGIWTGGDKHLFHTNAGEVLPVHRSFMCQCVKRFSMFIIGSSHLRNAFYCLFSACKRARVMRNAMFHDGLYMDESYAMIKAVLDNAIRNGTLDNLPKQRVIAVQSGSWDLAFRDFKHSTLDRLPQFMKNLSELQAQGERVIVIGAPSLPNEGTKASMRRVSRNNEIAAAFNQHESELAQKYHLEFVDMFSVTFPRYRERALEYGKPTHHYIAAGCKGLPGIVSLELLFTTMCPHTAKDYDLWNAKINEGYTDEQARLMADYGE